MIYLNTNDELIAHAIVSEIKHEAAEEIARRVAEEVSYNSVVNFIAKAGFEVGVDNIFQNWQGGTHHQFHKPGGILTCYTDDAEKKTAEIADDMIFSMLRRAVAEEIAACAE